VIVFGSPINDGEAYRRYAEPGIGRVAEPDSVRLPLAAVDSVARSYNLLLDAAGGLDGLEALVLVHPHVEIADPGFVTKIRAAFADPDVAVLGCVGATGVNSLAWWEGEVVSGPLTLRYLEHGGGDMPAFAWAAPNPAPAEVEAVDGLLLVLSPWAIEHLRFDESLTLGHGYDIDFCLRARAAGHKVIAADLKVIYHQSLELIGKLELWTEAHVRLAQRLNGRLRPEPADEAGWRRRARRAEAEREAARSVAFSGALRLDARVAELERELEEKLQSRSWRVTAPLRWANRTRRTLRDRRSRD
jgi:Glycosyltransferase like family